MKPANRFWLLSSPYPGASFGLAIAAMIAVIKLVQSLRHIAEKASMLSTPPSRLAKCYASLHSCKFLSFCTRVAETVAQHKSNDKGNNYE